MDRLRGIIATDHHLLRRPGTVTAPRRPRGAIMVRRRRGIIATDHHLLRRPGTVTVPRRHRAGTGLLPRRLRHIAADRIRATFSMN